MDDDLVNGALIALVPLVGAGIAGLFVTYVRPRHQRQVERRERVREPYAEIEAWMTPPWPDVLGGPPEDAARAVRAHGHRRAVTAMDEVARLFRRPPAEQDTPEWDAAVKQQRSRFRAVVDKEGR